MHFQITVAHSLVWLRLLFNLNKFRKENALAQNQQPSEMFLIACQLGNHKIQADRRACFIAI